MGPRSVVEVREKGTFESRQSLQVWFSRSIPIVGLVSLEDRRQMQRRNSPFLGESAPSENMPVYTL